MTSSISSRRKSRRKSDRKSRRKSRRKLRRKLRRKTKRKYRKQGGTRQSRKNKRERDKRREAKNKRTTNEDAALRRHRERNDPEKALRKLKNMASTAGHPEITDMVYRDMVMSPDDRIALSRRMLAKKRFGQKDESQFVDVARVAFRPSHADPNIPTIGIGQQLFEGNIRELITCQGLNPNQDREVRRLAARLHLAALDDTQLGLTLNPQPTTVQQRQAILQPLWPWGRETATGENLPYPLQIMRKSRRYHIAVINPNYPTRANGEIDETDDMFWPTTREQIFNFMKDIPTLQELEWFGL